jgi:hypothetical protein
MNLALISSRRVPAPVERLVSRQLCIWTNIGLTDVNTGCVSLPPPDHRDQPVAGPQGSASEPPALPAAPFPLRLAPSPPAGRRGPDRPRMAWLGLLLATGWATVSYSEWRSARSAPGGNEPIAAADPSHPEPAADASGPWPDPLVSLYETRADAARPIKLKFSIIDPWRAASRVRSAKPKPVGSVAEATPAPRPSTRWPSRPATLPPAIPVAINPAPAVKLAAAASPPAPPRPATPPPARPGTPAPAAVEPRRSPEEVRPTAATPAAAPATAPALARVDPRPGEEERIRTTLARFRSAYAQLDASAAREVWPSVDVRALERAFDGLKSQELRFDRCSFTVDGARAKAACTGRAVYVPRIGNQSPRSAPREWTFELRKIEDERWTIASARSS